MKARFYLLAAIIPFLLSACGGGSSTPPPPPPSQFTIGGSVSGLSGTGLVLQDNGGDNLSVSANGSFTFKTSVTSGGAYSVTVLTQPSSPAQTCAVTNGSGTATANVTNVQVACTTVTHTIGGTVSNLVGTNGGLQLLDNGGDTLNVDGNGSFTFATAIDDGGAYAVTISMQPSNPAQTCGVTNGTGTATANVTNVMVDCTDFLETLYRVLQAQDGGRWDGVGYALTHDNQLGSGLVAQTPPGLWGMKAEDYKIGAGDFMVSRIQDLIAGAEDFVDITTLHRFPYGQFENGIQSGLEKLASSGRHVRVRILAGYPPFPLDPFGLEKQSDYLEGLVKPLKSLGGNLEIFVAAQRTTLVSWNHAKMVAVDGTRAIVGGENLWDADYLEKAPVHDLNVELSGSAVYHMHLFADEIWKSVCGYKTLAWKPAYWKSGAKAVTRECLAASEVKKVPGPGQSSVLGAGRFGPLFGPLSTKHSNPADYAMLLSFQSAQAVIRIAQQDLGFGPLLPLYWEPGMQEIAKALIRGCDVYIVLSNDHAKSGSGGDYTTGTTVAQTADKIKEKVKSELGAPEDKKLTELLCEKLHLTTLRFGPSDKWPDPPYEFANHSKFFMVDDKVFYVGSENLYPSDLIEYGVFISDPAAVQQMREEYWDELWRYSKRVAISGSDAPACHFK
jgi:phosphatidylserine/phosphatidylglycerophosphate/cardiolipin synthase-like enzyme